MLDTVTVPKAFLNMEARCLKVVAMILATSPNPSQETINRVIAILRDSADDLNKLASGE